VTPQPSPLAGFTVELAVYSGPFRLLADLILDQKVDVCDVSVGQVTERFLAGGMERLERWSLEEATWFLAVCAVLLELKVGRLLPRAPIETEEDLLGGTSPDLLFARSLELAAFRRVAERLASLIDEAALLVPRTAGPPSELAHLYPDIMEKVRPEVLARLAGLLLTPPALVDLSHVTPIRATLADALDVLRVRLEMSPESLFRDLIDGCAERIDVVVRFLAVLELHRRGQVELRQAGVFGDIEVRWQGLSAGSSEDEGEDGFDMDERMSVPPEPRHGQADQEPGVTG